MEEEKIVTINFENIGLANVIWKIASAYGISIKRNAKFYLGENLKQWQNISGFCGPFPELKSNSSTSDTIKPHYVEENYPGVFENRMFEEWSNYSHIRVGNYLQSRQYFAHCEKDVIKMFQPKKEYIDKANLWFEECGVNIDDIKVCIHIRGGDMNVEPQTLPDNEWFIKAINKMPSNAKIIIFSDDFDLVRRFSAFSNENYIFAENNSTMLDFTLMTCCNNFILSRGTFSWWAAFLSKNRNKVIYHDEFLNTKLENHFIDYYPDNWELLDFNYTHVSCNVENKPKISINNDFNLINYYYVDITDKLIDINCITNNCEKANRLLWHFQITQVEGNFTPIFLSDWTLSINSTRKLVLVLAVGDNSLLELQRENITNISLKKNQLCIFPAYILYKCSDAAVFYAVGDTFK